MKTLKAGSSTVKHLSLAIVGILAFSEVITTPAYADLHWNHTTSPFNITVVDSLSNATIRTHLNTSITNWGSNFTASGSTYTQVAKMVRSAGDTSAATRRDCVAIAGKIHVCNFDYGVTTWGGLTSGTGSPHINYKTVKFNDRNGAPTVDLVCHELGHALGLAHSTDGCTNAGGVQTTTPSLSEKIRVYNNHNHFHSARTFELLGATSEKQALEILAQMKPTPLTDAQKLMAGDTPMGTRIFKGVTEEIWVAVDRKGDIVTNYVTLAPGYENRDGDLF